MAKTPQSKVGAQRAALYKLTSFNPIRGLTPARLAAALDGFDRGELRAAAQIWQKIMERDDQVKTCAPKRTRKVTGLSWEVLPIDDSPEADAHAKALTHFYNNLRTVDGLDENVRGGMRLLIKQLMSAVALRYAAFEVVWKPGAQLTAELKFLPLQFFENTTGRLRYLRTDSDLYGVELDEFFGPGNWMLAHGDGVMGACSVAWMFKNMPLKAWVTFCEKFGIPGLHAQTSAGEGSKEWDALVSALNGFGEDLAIVTNEGAKIAPLATPAAGNQPHPALVDRMDRAISRLWFGGDLATMSADGGAVGSQPQSDDLAALQEDDAAMITDTLQEYLDRAVIRQLFGVDEPLAYFQLKLPARTNVERELKVDQALVGLGVPLGVKSLQQRYGRPAPEAAEALAQAPAAGADAPFGVLPPVSGANERRLCLAANDQAPAFGLSMLAQYGRAARERLAPLRARFETALEIEDAAARQTALEQLRAELPAFLRTLSPDSPTVKALENALGTALASGAAEARSALLSP